MASISRGWTLLGLLICSGSWPFFLLVRVGRGSNMPWEQPLQQILLSIEGPVSKIIAVIIIIVTGLSFGVWSTPLEDSGVWFKLSLACRSHLPLPRSSCRSFLCRGRGGVMTGMTGQEQTTGYEAPVHRALSSPFCWPAPRATSPSSSAPSRPQSASGWALACRTAAVAGWTYPAAMAAKRDPSFLDVVRRHPSPSPLSGM